MSNFLFSYLIFKIYWNTWNNILVKTFEKYLYKSKTDIIKMCIKIEDMDLLNEFDEFIEIGGINSSAKEEILNTIENENVKETFLSYFN